MKRLNQWVDSCQMTRNLWVNLGIGNNPRLGRWKEVWQERWPFVVLYALIHPVSLLSGD